MSITFEKLMDCIANVAQAERITKEGLRTLSRDILAYMLESEDVRPVNALLGKAENDKFVLTPMNWRVAVQYFAAFLPFTSNFEEVKDYAIKAKGVRQPLVFAKKSKKRWDRCAKDIAEWLEDESNDIWSWSANVKMEVQPTDYAKKIQQAVNAAMDEGKGNMSLADVMSAIVAVEDVNVHDLMAALEQMAVPQADAA